MDDDQNVHASAEEVIEALEAHCPYTFIIIDTADMASKMCTDYHCDQIGVKHPSDGGDFGKGWDLLQTSPFRRFFGRIVKLGVGIACTSHLDVKEVKDPKTKAVKTSIETTLPKGIQKFIHTQADVIINGSFGRRRKNQSERDRIISFDGSSEILAGTRIRGVVLPKKYVVAPPTHTDQSVPWRQWCLFFDPQLGPSLAARAEELFNTEGVAGPDDENVITSTAESDGTTGAPAKTDEADAEKQSAAAEVQTSSE